jgi:hypothetical protein
MTDGTNAYVMASAICLERHVIGGYHLSDIGYTSLCQTCTREAATAIREGHGPATAVEALRDREEES